MCHVFRFGSSDTYRLVVSADVVWVSVGSGWEAGSIPEKQGGALPRKSSDTGLGVELRRDSKRGAVFRSHF